MSTLVLHHPTPRILAAVFPALLTCGALLLIMYSLIATQTPELEETAIKVRDFVMEPPPEPEVEIKEPVQRVEDPTPPPEWTPQDTQIEPGDTTPLALNPPTPDAPVGNLQLGGAGTGIVVIFRVAPDYPQRARTRGIEGYVDLSFDITATGRTDNIRIVDAQPAGVFERASIRALSKWKYKPPVENGIAQPQKDMMTRITFALDGN